MPVTVIVRAASGAESRLTFDGTQRIVLGRGAGCDVRLPDASVSSRHATVRAQGADFSLVDEGSTNGTFVGEVRIAPRTSRVVRSGDRARLGRVWIEIRIDHSPVTRHLAVATLDVARALVEAAIDAIGEDRTVQVRVAEGPDQGATLSLAGEGRPYVVGRAAECDLPLADEDASRQHVEVVRRDGAVFVRELQAKNGSWLGEVRIPTDQQVPWKPTQMIRLGRTVLSLREPVGEALAQIESAPDEPVPADEVVPPPPGLDDPVEAPPPPAASAAPIAGVPTVQPRPRRRAKVDVVDLAVLAAGLGVIALSLAALVWLLRG